jgi:hypothetical protein
MAKIGYLMLNDGSYQGRQIVSPEWIAESTKGVISANPIAEYGYQWWCSRMPVYLQDVETFFAAGTGGQQILIAPGIDLVVVLTSAERDHDENLARNHAMLTDRILPAAIPLVWSKTVVWAWLLLTGVALIGYVWSTGGRTVPGIAWHWRWAPIIAFIGPLGWLLFRAAQQRLSRATLTWWHALIESMTSVAGNALGILLWLGPVLLLSLLCLVRAIGVTIARLT